MNARFYAPDARVSNEIVALPPDEAAHLTRVLRLGRGAAVRVFDGRGAEFDAIVEHASSRDVRVRVGPASRPSSERSVALTLAQAVLKGEKMDDVVRDATMMGVTTIVPLLSARCETSAAALERGRRRERWERIAISSAKQCGRAVVPRVLDPSPLPDVLTATPNDGGSRVIVMLVEPGASAGASIQDIPRTPPATATIIVGPEGGWTPSEIVGRDDKTRLVTLRGATLRADAMAVVGLTTLLTHWGEL